MHIIIKVKSNIKDNFLLHILTVLFSADCIRISYSLQSNVLLLKNVE